ncbi:MAG: hypothetical protein QF609_05970 [Gammaproteobacteria bacterium]|jgi:hypothetical protein|nr:hypothetical protein [Gammaproteobacteria bacterium]HJP36694.1 hypothetical protein [Gammaproteobacteria bacterium]
MTSGKLWYLKLGDTIEGPFPVAAMRRNIVLGRVKPDALLSQDRETWVNAANTEEFQLVSVPERAERDFNNADERKSERRSSAASEAGSSPIGRRGSDRRAVEPEEMVRRRALSNRIWLGLRKRSPDTRFVWPALAIAILGVVGLGVLMPSVRLEPPDCQSAPFPGVNWESCELSSADLRRIDIRGARAQRTFQIERPGGCESRRCRFGIRGPAGSQFGIGRPRGIEIDRREPA